MFVHICIFTYINVNGYACLYLYMSGFGMNLGHILWAHEQKSHVPKVGFKPGSSSSRLNEAPQPLCYGANSANIRQSKPDSGLVFGKSP